MLNSITRSAFGTLVLLAALLAAAFLVFARVMKDYRVHGRLSRPVAILQTGFFCVYALASYAFLDSRLSHVSTVGLLFPLALALMILGFLMSSFRCLFWAGDYLGREVGRLRIRTACTGSAATRSWSADFLFIAGYAMLWPSWKGALWASLWLVIAHVMVRGEEEHLEHVFGDEYHLLCASASVSWAHQGLRPPPGRCISTTVAL